MPHEIEVDDEVYGLLRSQAEPFTDTPNTVLRRLLGLVAAAPAEGAALSLKTNAVPAMAHRAKQKKPGKRVPRSRAAAGTLLPEQEYEIPVLTALDENGGSAPSKAVIDRVGELVKDRLTEADHQPLSSGGLRWQNRIQFVRLRLIERGLMAKNTPRGIWGITDSGRAYLGTATANGQGARNGN